MDIVLKGFFVIENGQLSICKLEEDFDVKVDFIFVVSVDVFLKFDVILKFFFENVDDEVGICGVIM